MLYSHPKWGPYVFFWSKICNSKLFSSLSDSENSKWAIWYVCAIKNALVRRTIMKVSLTHCNDSKYPFNYQFGVMKVFQKLFQSLQTPTVDLPKNFFLHSFRVHFAILRENREKWRASSFSAVKNRLWCYQTLRCTFLESLRPKQQLRYPSCDRWML